MSSWKTTVIFKLPEGGISLYDVAEKYNYRNMSMRFLREKF